jgi:RecA-family ATPase
MSDRPKTYPFGELLNHSRTPDTDAIIEEGILKKNSIMVVGGPPKSYKSFVLNTIAIDLVIGRHLFTAIRSDHGRHSKAFEVRAPQKVLIFEQEIGEDDLEDRIKPIFENLLPEAQSLLRSNLFTHSLDHRLQLDTVEGVTLIADEIAAVRPSVVMFDPLIEFHTSNENDTQDMARILRNVDLLREEYKFATTISHHEGKETQVRRAGADRLRGNSALYGKGDSFLMLKVVNRNASVIACDFTVRRGKPISPFTVKLNPVTMRADFFEWGKPTERKPKSTLDAIQ